MLENTSFRWCSSGEAAKPIRLDANWRDLYTPAAAVVAVPADAQEEVVQGGWERRVAAAGAAPLVQVREPSLPGVARPAHCTVFHFLHEVVIKGLVPFCLALIGEASIRACTSLVPGCQGEGAQLKSPLIPCLPFSV